MPKLFIFLILYLFLLILFQYDFIFKNILNYFPFPSKQPRFYFISADFQVNSRANDQKPRDNNEWGQLALKESFYWLFSIHIVDTILPVR